MKKNRKRRSKNKATRGITCCDDSRIYLHKDNWCIRTVYHEMLHICSLTSSPNLVVRHNGMKHKAMYEGLTELLTGYVLSKTYPHSYHNCWWVHGRDLCQMTYDPQIYLWAAFCQCLSLSNTFPIYFNQTGKEWKQITTKFEDRVRSAGFKNFDNPLDDSSESDQGRFFDECINAFGEKFQSAYETRSKGVDFGLIRL